MQVSCTTGFIPLGAGLEEIQHLASPCAAYASRPTHWAINPVVYLTRYNPPISYSLLSVENVFRNSGCYGVDFKWSTLPFRGKLPVSKIKHTSLLRTYFLPVEHVLNNVRPWYTAPTMCCIRCFNSSAVTTLQQTSHIEEWWHHHEPGYYTKNLAIFPSSSRMTHQQLCICAKVNVFTTPYLCSLYPPCVDWYIWCVCVCVCVCLLALIHLLFLEVLLPQLLLPLFLLLLALLSLPYLHTGREGMWAVQHFSAKSCSLGADLTHHEQDPLKTRLSGARWLAPWEQDSLLGSSLGTRHSGKRVWVIGWSGSVHVPGMRHVCAWLINVTWLYSWIYWKY